MRSLTNVLMRRTFSIFSTKPVQTVAILKISMRLLFLLKVKHNARMKILKFTLQICAFIYQRLMDVPTGNSQFVESETLTTLDLFENAHRAINVLNSSMSVETHISHKN